MQIFLKTLIGKTLTFDVDGDFTVADLKRAVYNKEEIEPEYQGFVFAGQRLEEGKKFSYYGISKESTLYFVHIKTPAKDLGL